jgi:hypothetical protein
MKDWLKLIWILAVVVITFGILGGMMAGQGLFFYKFFAPKFENARREVFEQTKSYQEGMSQELRAMQERYITATPSQQAALRDVILHRVADYPEENLPSDLRAFLGQLRAKATY